ncbi:LacI family DNA-binding transcriptional regulator [Thermobifida halotolerans]|uniref:LacI family DNA-binding transcriptional regulator n=1 Tax=Thermobifida halotolerans TaxID=483545 RepID=A0A399G3B7_9ACTN|nr:LacI family DNA-binding transcriptional regulator [Thermobifida halotolerans]UOE17878.1 LacI family DNA-binding transcriptional regulator [Thermobifida halotolerans]
MPRLPTVTDVARAAGVSRQTVSNVLNSPEVVRPDTRERVERAIEALGYRPHASARRLRTRRSSTIGIRLDPFANGISGAVLDRYVHALTERAAERGLRVLLYTARSPEEEIEQLRSLIEGADVDAFVLTSTFRGDPRTGWLLEHDVPFATFGRPWDEDDVGTPRYPWVDVDGAAGTAAATEYALEQGARRVGFLGWPASSGTGDDRERGWRETLQAHGVPADGLRYTVEEDVPQARRAMTRVLSRDDPPDAVVCASDSLALGAHLAASDLGRSNLLVVGFDNTPVADALGFASVEQLPDQIAAGTLDLLMGSRSRAVDRARAAPRPAHLLVTPRLVRR